MTDPLSKSVDDLVDQKLEIESSLREALRKEAEGAPHQDIDLDSMTPELWKSMTLQERRAWRNYWKTQGQVSFCCLVCGYPTVYGTVGCEACRLDKGRQQEGQSHG